MNKKVAIVTGRNKGIGLAVVKGLDAQFNGDVYLTARNERRGMLAIKELKKEGINASFYQLDIDDKTSIKKLRNYIKEKYGGIDVLVNNAGISFKRSSAEPMHVQTEIKIQTNYFGTNLIYDILFPILNPGARVVTVSSSRGFLLNVCGDEPVASKLKTAFASSDS